MVPQELIGRQGVAYYVGVHTVPMAWRERLLPFCGQQELLWLPENARTPKYSYLPNIKHAICTSGIVKSFKHGPI